MQRPAAVSSIRMIAATASRLSSGAVGDTRWDTRVTVAPTRITILHGVCAVAPGAGIPDLAVTTDLIVGFPGETDADFEATCAVVRAAGGGTEHIVKLLAFVTDLDAYRAAQRAIGEGWRSRMGKYYPAMSLVKVAGLLEPGALVEIEAVAMLP